jgi:site-specific DNA-cytosine methylase
MAERPLYTLYKNLKAQNYDVPDDYNKFESALTRDGKGGADNRHAIYENLKAQNFDVPSTYERFYSALFEPRSKTSSRAKGGSVPMSAADRARFSAGAAAISASAQHTMNNAGRYNILKQRKQKQQKDFGRVNLGTHQTPFGGDANNVVKDDFAYNPETRKTGAYVTSDNENAYTQNDAEQKQAILDQQNNAYQQAVDTGEIPSVLDVRDQNGNYDLQENIGKNGTYLTEEGAQKQFDKKLADAYARKKEIEALIAEDNRQHGNPLLSYGASIGASNGRTAEQSDYRNKLATSLSLVTEQIGALEAVKQYPTSSWGEDALKAFDNTAFTAKTWDFGLTDFATMGQMERIKTKMDNNIPLSGSDKMLLKSKLGADAAAALEDENMGNIYRWTKIAGQSLPFMADFFLTGGYGGITKGISRGALKFAAKRGMGKVSAAILKNTGIVAGDVIGSYAMAGTEQALKTGADIMQRHLGNLYQDEKGDYKFGTFDENGNLLHEGGESMGTALYKGLTSAMVENYTEKLFGHNYGIKKGAVNFMEKHGMNASAEFFKNIGKSGWYTNSKKWMEKFGINGFAEEVMEEEIGIPLHALLDGEGKVSDLLDARQQLDIIGGMAISVGSMYAMGAGSRPVKGVYNRAQYYRFRHKLDVADSDAQNLIGDNWADVKDKIDNATNEQMGSVLAGILRQRDTMTKEQINAAVNYGVNLMKMRGYNIAKTSEMNAREITNEPTTPEEQHQTDIDNAYSEGHDADDADKHDIQIQQEDQMKTLAAALGISEQQLSVMSDEELESLAGQDDKLDQAIYDYQLSSARYQGVVDDAQDKVDFAAHQAEQRVDMYTDQSRGSVRNATIKASGGQEDYGVYIISGNIATHDDGSIDVSNSDDMILYYDPTTNSVEHADALMFAELGEELPADDVKAQAVADAKEIAIKEVAGIIDGTVEVGSQFKVTGADGMEHIYEVLADYGDGTAAISIDGNVVENPYSLEDLQNLKDLEDQKRLEAAKAQREQMEKERAEQQNQEIEQTEEAQPSFDFNQILNDDGNVVLVDVLDKDGNTKYPDSRLFLIRDTGAKAKVVELKSDGSLVPHAVSKKNVSIITSMSLDEYKQAMAESSMIEDNSGENRGEIEVENPTIEGETAAPESAETPVTEQTPAAPSITLEDGTIVPMLEDGNPDFTKLTAAQTAELYDSQFGEDADSVISGWVSDAKKALDKASNMTVKGKTFVEQKAAKDAKEKAIADAQAAYDSAIAIRDAYNERQLAKVEDTAEGRKELIEKARRKFARLKSAVKNDAEAVSQIYKETIGTLLHRLYDGTGIDVTDTIPLTAEEYVASNLGAHSLNYEGTETSKGVKQETGLSREDFAKTQLLAADGKGTTIDNLVHSLWENRPSNLESLDTQEIRNALIDVLTSGFKASEARNYIENLRIAQAENILEEQKKAAENAAYAEEQKAKQEEEKAKQEEEKAKQEEEEKKAEEKTHSEAFNKIVDLAKKQEEILDNPDNVKEYDKINREIDELLKTLSDEEFKEVSDALLNIDEDFEYMTADEYERREGVEESKKAKAYNESLQQAIKQIAPYSDALKAAVKSGDKKAIANAQKELTDALLASTLGHGYLSSQLAQAKMAKKKDETYSENRAFIKPLTDAINAIESALDSAIADAGLEGVHVDFKDNGHGWIYADKGSEWSSRLKPLDNNYRNVSQYDGVNPDSVLPQITMDNVAKVAGIIKSRIEEGERYNSDEYNDEENEKINDNINENINAPEQTKFPDKLREGSDTIEVPEDATDENPLGAQRDQTDLPFSAKENGTQQTTSEREADVEKNKVDDMKVVDNIVGQKTRKAFERLAKMMGASIQWQYSDKLGNGWIQETKDADGNVHRTIFITLDSSITEGAQFIFGHEMTHQIKNLNPAAYNELTQLVIDTYGSDAFDKAVDETMKRYSDAGFSGRARDYYAEEVVADAVGEMIRDLNLAHTLAMKMSHPLLAAIHEILQKIKLAFYGTEYSDVTKNIIRSIEQAYVKTANGQVTNTETGEDVSFSLRQKPEPKKKGIGYKVFVLKDGKLYPPMVANPDGAATPVGVWLDADAAPIAGESKTGRPQVKQGGKGTQGGSGKLAYRPGWHLGVVPYAIQFNRKDAEGNKTLFPKNFVFAEVEYAADVDYQEEARQEGINPSGKYQHSLAGLKHLPTDGYYMYRTNPNPETDPWVITGAMKVNRILTRAEQAELVKNAGREPQQIQDGDIVTDDVVNSINQEIADAPKFSIKTYHGSQASFDKFDHSFMGSGEGAQAYGWGTYVSEVEGIAKAYAKANAKKNAPSRLMYQGKPMTYKTPSIIYQVALDMDKFNISAKEAISKMIDADEKKLASVGDTPFAKMKAKQVQDELKVLKDLNPSDFKINEDYDTVAQDLIDTKSGLDLLEDELKDAKSYVDLYQSRLDEAKEELSKAKESGTGLGVDMYESDVEYYSEQVKRYKQSIKTKESDIKDVKTKVDALQKKLDSMEKPRNLYSVDIPDDTGRNYIGWDEPLGAAKIMRLPKVFKADGWEYKKVGMYDTYKIDGNEHEVWLEPTLTTGKELYRDLTNALGSDKAASEFLSKAGFVGVKVIAQRNTGGNKEGKMNYVIFDENNAQITSHTKFSLKDNQGNPLNQDGTLKLDKIKSVDELTDEDFLHPTRNVELPSLPKKIADAIGTEGKPVVIKKNIFERNYMRHKDVTPELSKTIFKSALYNTDLYGQNQKKTRPYNWVLINTKDEKGNNRTVLLEVNPNKDNVEIVHWHFVDERGLEKIKKQADREDGQLLILPSNKEEVGALSDPTVNLSAAKIDNSSETAKENEEKVDVEEPKTFEEFLNHPSLKFSIKNEEQRKAAEDAYEYASKLRPNKYAQYALVDMSNPSKSPEYYEKKVLADRWRRFYNKAVQNELDDVYKDAWGNYKLFDLDQPFDDQVNEVKGDVPSEFNAPDVEANKNADNESGAEYHEYKQDEPSSVTYKDRYKAFKQREANREKTAGLRKELKEVEDSYNSKSKQRIEYNKQLMKEYMDKHGLSSENDIPEDIWNDLRDKSFEKYQDELDSLFNKYKDLDRQIKAVAEPRFSLKDEKTLAGVHNITEEKLRKALKLGGFANPSLAVIDTSKSGHDNFGEISFIAPSSLLDKRTGNTGGTWITDAYTQRYPSIEREMSEKGSQKFKDWVDSLEYPSEAKAEIKRQAEDALSNNNAPAWELMYLKEKGIDIKEYDSRIDYRWKEIISDHPTAEDILNSMKTDPELKEKVMGLAKHTIIHPTWEKISLEVRRKIYKETGVKASPIHPQVRKQTREIFERDYKPTLLDNDGNPKMEDVKKVVEDIVKEHNDTKQYDFYLSKVKASNYVNKNGLYDDYIRWQENKLDEFGTKNRIFRGYTKDGSRKYVPETLENVSKAMREEADGQTNGSEYTSFGSFIAKLASRVDSTDEMRANKDKLSSNKDKEEFYEKWNGVYYDLAKFLYNDVFYGEQRLHDIVLQSDPKKYAKKEYGITLTPTFMKKLDALKNAVQTELKSAYFETKYNRPLRLNEFAAAVVPDNLGEDVRKGIENAGLPMYDYDPNKEGDRSRAFNEAINSSDNIRFSLAGERGAAAADKAEERTARMDNLSVARKMEEEKKDAKAIKMATGWERGADGKWRYEMPDAKIKDTMDVGGGHIVKRYEDDMLWNGGKLSNVIDAPELFKAYPQLKDVRIDTDAIMNDMPSNGEYNSKTNTITIHADELKYMNGILNHEIQHVIQDIEGFAKGGSPRLVRGEVKKRFDEVTKQIKQLRAEGKEDEAKTLIEKNRGLYNAYQKNDDFNSYKSLAGEVEARNVSARLNMTPEERRKTLAESTEDVARKDQIFLGVGDVSFSLRDMADGKESGAADMAEDLKSLNTPDEVDDAIKTAIDDMPSGWQMANKKMIHIAQALGENRKAEISGEEPKFSLKAGTLIKAGTYFSGGGLVEEGLKGIIDPVVAVEYDEKISGVYRNNFGQHIVTADVRDVDPKELVKQIDGEVEYFHASPVCKNYSQAKNNHAEVELDKETAASTAEFINAVKPKVVTIENVKGYKDSDAMKTITDALDANGYTWDADVYNAADFGGYTNRERLIVRAVRDGKLPAKPKKMEHKSGWYEAVADIIPTLTEKKNGVANWMDVRLKADGIDWRNIDKPLYVMGSAYADGKIPHAFADELLPTLRTKSGDVIVMPDGKVYRAMGRVLARVSGVSDDYKMPFSENLSHTIIGNGIPTQLTEHVIAPLVQNSLRPTPEDGNTKFSLRYDKFEHDLNQWKKDNNLPKDAQRPTIPQRNAGESAVDFLRRVDEYRKQMALWKTAPTYEQHLLSDDTALGEFNRELQRGSVLKRIAFQDSMLAIRKAQEAIMKEVGVDRLNMAEDAYTAENRSHGKGKNEFEEYNNEFLQPLRKAYHQMKKILGDSYDNVRIYMMAKHGLERDAQMAFKKSLESDFEDVAQRSAAYKAYKGDMNRIINDSDLEFGRVDFNTWRQRDNALRTKYSPSYMDYRYDKNGIVYDYSGLSALFGGSDFEEAAHKLVRDIESKHVAEVQDLWNATNAATKKILRDGYKAGMMSKDTYLYVRDMYSHYIPLRGWDGTTADQVWDYVGGGKGAFNQTLKTAHGRTSIADDPIAYIENMAESGILLNNKNWVKQHLMLLAQNHPTSLLTLSKAWYVKSTDANGNEEWIPATPQITSQMDSNQVKAVIDAFEQKMEQMAQTGDATQQRDGLNIAYPQTHSEEREHEVRVMKDGEEYVIYVNGDPQLAQAMNNTRAHRVREIQSGKLDRAAAWLGRKMAAAYTSLSPLFIPSNYFRDLTMTLASTAIREDGRYNYLLRKNLATSWNLGFMLKDYQNGKLREKVSNGNATKKEQMFYDFMMNGGETGFVSSLDVEDLKKKFKKDLKDLDRWKANPVKVGHTIMDGIEFLNRMIEDSNRFAVYMTSIQYGRSIDEAVNDAKDVTLNFNRKGTGEYGWQMVRNLYLFINPAVQSLQTLGALAKHHPFKFTAVTASWLASGVLVPIVNAALMSLLGGDDDKDKYWQFTKWDRRNNLIMWIPFTHEYVKIPLAQEFRAFYGVGDMIASKMMGGELAEESWSQYAEDLMGQVVDMLPLDPTGYDGNIAVSLMPNAIRPVFELAFNVDFTGKPLFKDTEYNKYDPNFTKAYVGTPDWLVRASKMVNSIGNDYPDVQQNSIDAFGDPRYNLNNPAVVDHVLSSYLGGAYTMGSQVLGLLTKSLNDPKEIKMADIPLFSKFVSNPDDRPVTKKQGDEFWNMKDNHDRAANTLSKLKKQAKVDGDYSMLERFYDSEEYKQYKQDDVKVKKYEEDKKKERAEESGEEYRPHKLNAEDIYKAHATPKDDFEDLKLKQLYTKLNGFKSAYDLLVDTAPSQSDGYYNTNKAAIDAIDEISLDKQEISELKKGFLDDGKDAYNAEDMKQICELRKSILAVLEKANKVVVANQKAKAGK